MRNPSILVVGAGLSGLTAAALLAKRGLDITVLEAGDRPGGSCSAFRRGPVTFDTGAAMLFGFGQRGFNPHSWLMGEIDEPIEVYRHEALYRLNYADTPVTFWPDREEFIAELCALFPGAKDDLAKFYAHLFDLYDRVISKVTMFEAPNDVPNEIMRARLADDPLAQLKMIGLLFRNTESLMKPFVKDPEVRRFFDKLTSTYCYTTLHETPAILAATMFVDNHVGGSFYPAGSAMSLAARLEKAVEKFGGRIRYGARVESLLRRDAGKGGSGGAGVGGVVLDSGETVEADAVLFTGAVKGLAERLDSGNVLPASWKRRMLRMEDSFPSFVVYGTVARSVLPAGLMPVEMFIDNREALDEGDVTLYVPSLEDPWLAPEDTAVFELIGPTFRRWPRPGDPEFGSPSYVEAKKAEADRMLGIVERRIPGFMAAMGVRIEGSPATIERYLSKPYGSVAGPKQKMGQHLLKRQGSRGPVPGLFFAGEGTVMGTGTPAVTVSGISAANRILRTFGKQDYRPGSAGQEAKSVVRILPRGLPGNIPKGELGGLASECLWCEAPSCVAACQAHPDIPGMMRRLEAGNFEGAERLARESGLQDLCAVCGDGADAPRCEKACIRKTERGRSVAIRRAMTLVTNGVRSRGWIIGDREMAVEGTRTV